MIYYAIWLSDRRCSPMMLFRPVQALQIYES